MTKILLISDTERVQRVFDSLGGDPLQIRTAATLVQADQEIAAQVPDFTFVQSRISGFSGDILLRHLKKVLPVGARIVFLAGDAGEVEQARRQAENYLDLELPDAALAQAVRQAVRGAAAPVKRGVAPTAGGEGGEAQAAAPAQKAGKETPRARQEGKPSGGKGGVPGPSTPERKGRGETVAAGGGAPAKPAEGAPAPAVPPAAAAKAAAPPVPEASDRVTISGAPSSAAPAATPSFEQAMREASARVEPVIPPAIEAPARSGLAGAEPQPAETEGPGRGDAELPPEYRFAEPLSRVMLREEKTRLPLWPFLLVAALVVVPLVSYLAGRRSAPPEPAPRVAARPGRHPAPNPAAAPPAAPKGAAAVPSPSAAATAPRVPATAPKVPPAAAPVPPAQTSSGSAPRPPAATPSPSAVPRLPAPAQPAGKQARPVSPAVPGAPPAVLPQVVLQAKPDPSYGRNHPGWQRFLGKDVEFKAFRKEERYEALQVLARDGRPITEQFFRKVLLEFGGVDKYLLTSSAEKGKYLVEQGVTTKAVSVTLYRNKADKKVRAFVLYYR